MPENPIKLNRITLRYTGLFDFDGLYTAVIDWAKLYGFKWHEKSYKHKVPSPKGAEQELDWVIEKKVTEYISNKIIFTIHTWDQQEVEVDTDGKKKTLTNARMYIVIEGELEFDWQRRFAGSSFAKRLGDWYRNIVYKKELEAVYLDQLYYRIWGLHSILKKYFDMQTQKFAYKTYLGEH